MPDPIDPIDALAISSISAEFGYLVDHGRAAECEFLFTPDAKLVFGTGSPKPGTLAGIEAIRAFLVNRQSLTHVTTRHIATNFRFTPLDQGKVECQSLLTVFRSEDETRQPIVSVLCDITEIFLCDSTDTWKIEQRVTTPIFAKS